MAPKHRDDLLPTQITIADMPGAVVDLTTAYRNATPAEVIGHPTSTGPSIPSSPQPASRTSPSSPRSLGMTSTTPPRRSVHDEWLASLPSVCPYGCGGLGWLGGVSRGAVGDGAAQLRRCPCQAETDRQRQVDALRADRGRLATADFDAFDAERELPGPESWKNGVYDTVTGKHSTMLCSVPEQRLMLRSTKNALRRWAAAPVGWIWLQGNYGSGKSHLGAAACNALAAAGRSTYYDSVPRLLKLLREGIADHSTDRRLQALIDVDVLMLDDLGMGQVSVWGEGQLSDMLNERYNAERPTIITSNVPILTFDGRGFSRCLEMCEVLTLVAFDYRRLLFMQRQG